MKKQCKISARKSDSKIMNNCANIEPKWRSKSIKIALKKQREKSSLKMCLPVDRVVPVEREARKDPGPGVPQGGKEGTPPLD